MEGDFNLGDIAWESEVPYVTNPNTAAQHTKLLQVLDDSSFTQHVKVPTRPASGKTLDILFSSYPNSVSNVSTQSGMSDHLLVLFDIHTKPIRSFKPPHKTYVYKRANWNEISNSISLSSAAFFNSNPEGYSVDENWNMFKSSLFKAVNDHIPQKLSGSKYKLPWITVAIKRHMRKQPRSQGLSFCHLGETLAAAGHVPPRFWEVNLIVTVRGVGKGRVCSILKLQLWVMKCKFATRNRKENSY
jgi:hypothetical protein